MNEGLPPPVMGLQTGARMPLGGRLMNVFTGPGEVFEEVRKGPPSTANWLLPIVLWCLVGIVSTFVVLSQDAIVQQIKEQQERAMQKKLEKLPKERREEIMELAEKWSSPTLMKIGGSVASVGRSFAWIFT